MFRFGLMAALLFGVIDPATQIKAAKEAIAAHDFDRAVILLREGLAELRRAFPDMPEFEMLMSEQGNGDTVLVGSFCFNWGSPASGG